MGNNSQEALEKLIQIQEDMAVMYRELEVYSCGRPFSEAEVTVSMHQYLKQIENLGTFTSNLAERYSIKAENAPQELKMFYENTAEQAQAWSDFITGYISTAKVLGFCDEPENESDRRMTTPMNVFNDLMNDLKKIDRQEKKYLNGGN